VREVSSATVRTNDMASYPIKDGSEVRFLGCQYYIPMTANTAFWNPVLADRKVELLDSSGGTALFTFAIQNGGTNMYGAGGNPVVLMLGNAAIRFPSGIHFSDIDMTDGGGATGAGDCQLVVFYEG